MRASVIAQLRNTAMLSIAKVSQEERKDRVYGIIRLVEAL